MKDMTQQGIADKFEFIQEDLGNSEYRLPEKVDCVIYSYSLTDFCKSHEELTRVLKNAQNFLKDDGFIMICDCGYLNIPIDGWMYGFTTTTQGPEKPKPYEHYYFTFATAPTEKNAIINIPAKEVTEAAKSAGYEFIEHKL